MHLMSVVALSALALDWTHVRTKDSNRIKIFATIYPSDGCVLEMKKRQVGA
jgi:sterol 22-desaturase